MSRPGLKDFEDLVNRYHTNAYSQTVEDFLSVFEFHYSYDELLYALVDAFRRRGRLEIANRLDSAAQIASIRSNDEK